MDEKNKHSENTLSTSSIRTKSGFNINISVATGVCGEVSCLSLYDFNLYDDEDSRSERPKEYIIPLEVSDLENIKKSIEEVLEKRKLTLL